MTIRYVKVTPDIKINGDALAEGVRGVSCLEARKPTYGEQLDYAQFIPWDCYLSSVEVYSNGARNFHVRTHVDDTKVAYLILRPMTEDKIDAQADRILGNYDVD